MSDIHVNAHLDIAIPNQAIIPRQPVAPQTNPDPGNKQTALPEVETDRGVFSAEAQYFFDMDVYLSSLQDEPREKAIAHLSQSNDVLQQKAAAHFQESWEALRPLREGKVTFDNTGMIDDIQHRFNDPDFVQPEIGIMPWGVDVFRLDGAKDFHSMQFPTSNDALTEKLNALEKSVEGVLGLQDGLTLFGSVRNALDVSNNILLSADDAIHFNYMQEKARTAIDFIKAPDNIKAELNKILNEGISSQDKKQTQFLVDSQKFVGNARVGNIVRENIRLGSAAQTFNNQLKSTLADTKISVLNTRGIISRLLMENTDLIRFGSDKVGDALAFYRTDFQTFQRNLNKDFSIPEVKQEAKDYTYILTMGTHYAMKVIDEIKNYTEQ